ncbi:hypothetical protein BUALT_Bualt09G0138400 [Buddleja alternifolia]|uniref:26S proteasome regulatory subunit 6B homolog n=1 Tax=Buddleja alternifolia TaxID=168488 RepID=A0AAV6X3T1_9LAMI|nr:hypothetical protein BUALT_Bualt09G0138400 [Buddleja alternifolia]
MAEASAGKLPPRLAVDECTVKKFKRGILGDEREYVPPSPLQDGEESMDMHDNNETEPRPNQWFSEKLNEAWKNSAPQRPYYFGNGEPEIANQNPNIGIPSVVDVDKVKELSWPNLNVPVEEWQKYAMPYMRALVVKVLGRSVSYTTLKQRMNALWQVGIAPKESNMTFMATKKNGYEHSDGNNNGKDTSGNTTSDVYKRTNGGAANKNKKNNGGSRFTVLIDEDEEGEGAIRIQGLGKAHGGSTSGTKSTTRTTRTQNKKDRRTIAKGKEKSDSNVEVNLDRVPPITKGTTYFIVNNSISQNPVDNSNVPAHGTHHHNRDKVVSGHHPLPPFFDVSQGDKNSTRVESIHDGDRDPDKGHGSSDMDQSGHDSPHALANTPHGDFDKLKETFGLHTDDFMRMGAEMSDDDLCTELGNQESPELKYGKERKAIGIPMAASAMVLDPKPLTAASELPPSIPAEVVYSADEEDLYRRLKSLHRQLEFTEIQEEYVKDELKNLKRELLRAQEEVKRIQSVPLVIGQFMEMIDQNNGIVGSTAGSNYYVRILSTINRELLKPSTSVALHRHSNSLVDVLPPEADSSISLLSQSEKPDVTYSDIGGCDIQKQEIREAVELPLTHHELYKQIGIDPPRGVLLYGPPGTGKTMLAKAVANHTTAAFIRVVGSEFVQKYLGEGPRMVRDVFRLAKENAPAIIFIDEVDAIATARFDAQTGADREVQRILMELLNQMDGFDQTVNVKVIMATNRADTLDPALLRPGRLDRKIEFPLPDRRQKRLVFQVCTAKMNLSDEVDLEDYVSRPDKISAAEIAAICQEAGLHAVRKNRYVILPKDFEKGYRSNVKKPDTEFEFYK